jgi:hypothetical protein
VTDEARVHAMIAAACLRAKSEEAFTADLGAFLAANGVAAEDAAAILASPPRLALYRRLVRNNLTGVTEKMLARTRARMNEGAAGAFDASFAAFLDEAGPRTHFLRDVPSEFLAWALPRWEDLPPWLSDLARHELVEFQVAAAETPSEAPPVTEVALERPLVFAEPLRLMRYAFAVHELPADTADRTEPAARATALLVYREREHAVRFLELTPLAAELTERLLAGAPLGEAIRDAGAALGAPVTDAVLADVARLLADYGQRGVLLGARA